MSRGSRALLRLRNRWPTLVATLVIVYALGPQIRLTPNPFTFDINLAGLGIRLVALDWNARRLLGFGLISDQAPPDSYVALGTALLAAATVWLGWQSRQQAAEDRASARQDKLREWALEIRERSLQVGGLATMYRGRLTGIAKGEGVWGDEMHKRRWDALFNYVDESQHRLAHLMRLREDLIPKATRVSFLMKMTSLEMYPADQAAFEKAYDEFRGALPDLLRYVDPVIVR